VEETEILILQNDKTEGRANQVYDIKEKINAVKELSKMKEVQSK
jgi:hypothetical protein